MKARSLFPINLLLRNTFSKYTVFPRTYINNDAVCNSIFTSFFVNLIHFRNTGIYLFSRIKEHRYVLPCIGVRMLDSWSELGGVRAICGATLPSASTRSTLVSSPDLINPTALLTIHFLKWVLMLLLCENLPPQLEQEYGLVPVW